MAEKSEAKPRKARSGPRAPAGKKPLLIVIEEDLIKRAKIAAIEDDTNVSGLIQEMLRGWLAGRKTRK